jgi:predicted HTH domain antitoxin
MKEINKMKIELELNDEALREDGFTEFDVRMFIGVALVNGGVISIGKTAEIVKIPYRRFYESMGNYEGIKIEKTYEDLLEDCENARNF